MTLNNATRSVEYPGDDSPGPFAFPFKIFDETHLVVVRTTADDPPVETTLALTTDYTVSGVRRANGSITLVDDLLTGETLSIRRRPPLTQLVSLRNQGPYYPDVVEDELDLLVMQIQGSADDVDAILDTFDERLDGFDTRLTTLEELVATLLEAQGAAAIPVPTLSAIAAPTEDGGLLGWSAGISFEYQIATANTFLDDDIVPGLGAVLVENPTELVAMLRFLEPETQYYVRMRAVGLDGDSNEFAGEWSNIIGFMTIELFSAQGGDIVTYDEETGYSTHIFNTSGDFEVLSGSQSVRALIVAAGGMGGGTNGSGNSCGGGGGGGVKELFPADWPELTADVYPVVVGTAAVAPAANNVGVNGGSSSFNGQTSTGGGFGGSLGNIEGDGGSGGGSLGGANFTGGRGKTNQGNDGGNSHTVTPSGGGGGGGADRLNGEGETATGGASGGYGGDGGPGYVSDIEGADAYYGAGGGGARPCDVFGVTVGSTPGAGGTGGGGAGSNGNSQGAPATGVGCGGGGAHGNNRGGLGSNGRVVIKYFGRAADVDVIDPPAVVHGPFNFPDCERENVRDGVTIMIDSNAKTDTGIYPDYREYRCDGSGDVQSSRWDEDYSGQNGATGNDGILVFRFSEPIVYFKITRKVEPGVVSGPRFYIMDDYSVRPDTSNPIVGSTADGAFINLKAAPTILMDMAEEEEMEFRLDSGFLCVVVWQTNVPFVSTNKFKDLYFTTLAEA